MRKIIMLAAIIAALAAIVAATAGSAAAAPIYCPGGQTAQKTDSGWTCVNSGDNPTGAGWHNGNGNKI